VVVFLMLLLFGANSSEDVRILDVVEVFGQHSFLRTCYVKFVITRPFW